MVFDPKRHLIKVQGGQQYLPVSARLIWFRSEHPDWGIETEPIAIDNEKQYAIFRARIYNAEGRLMSMGTKKEDVKGFGDYIEKAECVPLDTRILTSTGWKTYNELVLGESVLGYNDKTDKLEWVPLLAVRQYQDVPVVQLSNGKGFDVVCTPDHKWAVHYTVINSGKRYHYRKLHEAQRLTKADAITVGATAPSGTLQVTPQQAFVMGMLITDGCMLYHGKHIRGYISQTKQNGVDKIREYLTNVPHLETVMPAHTRTFPTGKTYDCRSGYRWTIASAYLHELHDAFQITHETELLYRISQLSQEARAVMMESMMLAEGDKRGNFAQMPGRNSWVIDLWTALCALEGNMVCKAVIRSKYGGIWVARRKKTRSVWASNVVVQDAGRTDVWCPQTPLGTWVARFGNDVVTITGNTGAVGRALALCGYGTQFSPELNEVGAGRFADSPRPMNGGNNYGGGGSGAPRGAINSPVREYNNAPRDNNNGNDRSGRDFGAPPSAPSAPRNPAPNYQQRPAPTAEPSETRPISAPEPQNVMETKPPSEATRRPERPAPTPMAAQDEDDFESLIGGNDSADIEDEDPFEAVSAPAPKPAPSAPVASAAPAKTDGHPSCVTCGKALTKAQQELSIRNYGEALCPTCQKDKTRSPRAIPVAA